MSNKKAQEEMIGFGVILVIIGVIILIVFSLMISSRKNSSSDSLLLKSFLLSGLNTKIPCEYNYQNLSLMDLIVNCNRDEEGLCENNHKNLCLMLNESVKEMVERGFQVSNLSYYKAYEVSIKMDDKVVRLTKGNQTRSYYSSIENFSRSSEDYAISLKLFV
jgi:hypothetical protein